MSGGGRGRGEGRRWGDAGRGQYGLERKSLMKDYFRVINCCSAGDSNALEKVAD